MGGHKSIRCSSYPTPPPSPAPIADLHIVFIPYPAELIPDCSGNYFSAGTYNGRTYYRRTDDAFFIWWYSTMSWYILSTVLGNPNPPNWNSVGDHLLSEYDPSSPYEGYPVVELGPQ